MRRGLILAAAVFGIAMTAQTPSARAQANFSDPFYLYYGFYLPRQQVLANQPGPEVGIMANQVARQQSILTDRASLYAPIRGVGEDELNDATPYAGRKLGRSGVPRFPPSGKSSTNLLGTGPPGYFNNTQSYFPGRRGAGGATAPRRAPLNLAGPGGGLVGAPRAAVPNANVPVPRTQGMR